MYIIYLSITYHLSFINLSIYLSSIIHLLTLLYTHSSTTELIVDEHWLAHGCCPE